MYIMYYRKSLAAELASYLGYTSASKACFSSSLPLCYTYIHTSRYNKKEKGVLVFKEGRIRERK